MLRHSKSAVSITFVCLSIAKLKCQISLGISFSLSNKPMHDILKRKICKEKIKSKKIKKNALKMIASMYLGDVGVIGCTLKVIVPIKQL